MRIRTIKPELWTSEQIMELSPYARLTFIGMLNFCDDAGIHPASPKRLKAEVWPADDLTAEDIAGHVSELIQQRLVIEYEAEGGRYWIVTGFRSHQRIDKPTYKHPTPPSATNSTSARRGVDEESSSTRREVVEPSTPETRLMETRLKETREERAREPVAREAPPADVQAPEPPRPPVRVISEAPAAFLELDRMIWNPSGNPAAASRAYARAASEHSVLDVLKGAERYQHYAAAEQVPPERRPALATFLRDGLWQQEWATDKQPRQDDEEFWAQMAGEA